MQTKDPTYTPARFRSRFIAHIIDDAVLLPLVLLGGYLGWINTPFQPDILLWPPEMNALLYAFAAYVVVSAVYYTLFHGLSGQTIGKRAMRIRVVRKDGSKVRLDHAFGRWFLAAVTMGFFGYGCNSMRKDPHRRTYHDILVGTMVIVTTSAMGSK